VNGVVRSLEMLREDLESGGNIVEIIGPERFRSLPMPGYPEIRLAIAPRRRLKALMTDFETRHGGIDALHLATEGPLGWAGRRLALRRGMRFSTAYHTRFPEYLARRAPVPLALSYAVVRHFHRPSIAVMTATSSLERDLAGRGFGNLHRWTRGVDLSRFRRIGTRFRELPRPVTLYVGRVAVEKNIEAFLDLDLPGTKVVTGDGPQLAALKKRYPEAVFTGALYGEDLAAAYSGADCTVFPSMTDTFGLTIIESLACGTPVAAFDAMGPRDILDTSVGAIDSDLAAAVRTTLAASIRPERCREYVSGHFSRQIAASQFLAGALK
jgi:glycosyltransferase involved in cell wall biosynthesis